MLQQAQWDKLLRIRGFLAFYVLFHHVRNALWPRLSELPADLSPLRLVSMGVNIVGEWGLHAVLAFFVVSGISIGIAYRRKFETPKFWKARLRRLYPAFLFSLAVTAGCYFLQHRSLEGQGINFLSTLLLQNGLTFGGEFAGNSPYWSLACEGFYYLLFPFLFFGHYGQQRIAWVALASVVLYFALEAIRPVQALLFYPVWLAGLSASFIVSKRQPVWITGLAAVALTLSLLLWIYLDAKKLLDAKTLFVFFTNHDVVALVSGAVVAILVVSLTQISWSLPLRKFRDFCGEISYSLYLVHYPILALVKSYFPSTSLTNSLVSSLIGVLLSVAIAFVSYRLFEMPFIKHRATFQPSKSR